MKRGFELLKTVKPGVELDVKSLEQQFYVEIPPLYELFCKTFDLGEDSIITDQYLNPLNNNDVRHCSFYKYEGKEIMFAGFNTLMSALENIENVDLWEENKYIPIGNCGFNGGIVLGTLEVEKDCIFLHDFDGEVELIKLADNIFEFVQNLVLEEIPEENLVGGVSFAQLYKNWGDDYWRVRED